MATASDLVSIDNYGGKEALHDIKDYTSQSLLTQPRRGENLASKMQPLKT